MRYRRAHKEPIGIVEASTFNVTSRNKGTWEDCCDYLDGGEKSVSAVPSSLVEVLNTTTIP